MFNSTQSSLLGRSKNRLSSISHLAPDMSPKARRKAKQAMMKRVDSAWTSMKPLRSRKALTWFGGAAAILSAAGLGYSFYSKKKKSSINQDW